MLPCLVLVIFPLFGAGIFVCRKKNCNALHCSRYTSKGLTVYAILTAKPPMSTVKLLAPKASAITQVKKQCCPCLYSELKNMNKFLLICFYLLPRCSWWGIPHLYLGPQSTPVVALLSFCQSCLTLLLRHGRLNWT